MKKEKEFFEVLRWVVNKDLQVVYAVYSILEMNENESPHITFVHKFNAFSIYLSHSGNDYGVDHYNSDWKLLDEKRKIKTKEDLFDILEGFLKGIS